MSSVTVTLHLPDWFFERLVNAEVDFLKSAG